jgi:hypothetical protein
MDKVLALFRKESQFHFKEIWNQALCQREQQEWILDLFTSQHRFGVYVGWVGCICDLHVRPNLPLALSMNVRR